MSEATVEEITIPLDMASLSQYKTGEDTLRLELYTYTTG
jgi:hypothetical protein